MAEWEWVHIKSSGHYLRKDGKAVIYASRGCSTDENRVEILRILNSHDQLVEALEEIEIRARMAQGRDAKIPPESEADMLRDIMRHLQGDARAALAAARGEAVDA